jgi:hypothetical protein
MLDFPNSPTTGQVFNNEWTWDGVKWAAIAPGMHDVGRNLLHNPLFNVAQRGTGFSSVVGSWVYTVDRWKCIGTAAGDTLSLGRVVAVDSDRTAIADEAVSFLITNNFTGGSGAANSIAIQQPIEGVRRLANKTVTVSFWAIASAALKVGVSFDQFFGTGGSPSAAANANGQSVTLSGAWTHYSVTMTVASAAGKTFGTNGDDYTGLNLWLSSGATNNPRAGNIGVQSGTINLWGVQLEIGGVMTPLEKPDPQQDLAKCQRFYQTGIVTMYGYATAGIAILGGVLLPVAMRAQPTVAVASWTVANITSPTISAMSAAAINYFGTVTATGQGQLFGPFTASADL